MYIYICMYIHVHVPQSDEVVAVVAAAVAMHLPVT